MKNETFEYAFSSVDDRFIEEACAAYTGKKKNKRPAVWAIAAAILVLALLAGGITAAADEREYKKAQTFFAENNLTSEGLTRSEMKKVYKDIVAESFSYDKTQEVLERTVSKLLLEGFELQTVTDDPEETKELIAAIRENDIEKIRELHQKQQQASLLKEEYTLRYTGENASVLTRLEQGKTLWELPLPFEASSCVKTSVGAFVFGETRFDEGPTHIRNPYAALVSENGKLLWIADRTDLGLYTERFGGAYEEKNGEITLISKGIRLRENNKADHVLICTVYNKDGTVRRIRETLLESKDGIDKTTRFSDGFLVLMYGGTLYRIDKEGAAERFTSYSENGRAYILNDLIEYGDSLLLSFTAAPENEWPHKSYRDEARGVMNYIEEHKDVQWFEHTSEDLVKALRDSVQAVLLVCTDAGEAKTFFTTDGALGRTLETDENGNLVWTVEIPATLEYSPFTNAYTFRGVTSKYAYVFNERGEPITEGYTGEFGSFWW